MEDFRKMNFINSIYGVFAQRKIKKQTVVHLNCSFDKLKND